MRAVWLIICASLPMVTLAAEIDTNFSVNTWNSRTTARLDVQEVIDSAVIDSNAVTVRNRSDSLGILKHRKEVADQSFTYSVDIKTPNSSYLWLGISFCLKSNLEGYYFTVDTNQTWMLFKYIADSTDNPQSVIIDAGPHSFVNSFTNTLKVSKDGDDISLFVNGRVVFSGSDPDFDSGSVGLVIHHSIRATFSNISWTTHTTSPRKVTCFTSDFVQDSLKGWYLGYTQETPSIIDSNLVLTSGDSLRSILVTSGDFDSSSIKAQVAFSGGSFGGAYGVTFIDIVRGGDSTSYRNYAFVLNPQGEHYGVIKPDSTRFNWSPGSYPEILGNGEINTIVVKRDNDKYHFMVNGVAIVDANVQEGFDIDGAGIIALPDTTFPRYVTMECSWFAVSQSDSFECPVHLPVPYKLQISRTAPSRRYYGIVFDPLGRKISSLKNSRFRAQKLPSGTFIIVSENNKKRVVPDLQKIRVK
ncbi:MAG: hypothetical protein GF401_11985 [Chitinivibrionales bacterium]|nr:hypothetical protein [Chitinivibrionales bacterium]